MLARLLACVVSALSAFALPVAAQDAGALRARHQALADALANNPFGRPIHVESSENGSEHSGAVYAVVQQPFERVAESLRRPEQWCEILILQANVKHCEAPNGAALGLFIARKPVDPLDQAYRAKFRYAVPAASEDYLRVALDAPEGPFGTSDYRIRLEAAALDAERTFVRLAYAYGLGLAARMGMDLYLAFSGSDKVGFSVVDRLPDGRPIHVGGVRGVVERNTMRYYLALEAYLDTLDAPARERLERRLRAFHAALERYPRQLRELGLAEYLRIKRPDASRVLEARS